MRASDFTDNKLVIFDIDDTLVHTQTKVHVVKDGRVVKALNSHEFTHYKLEDGEHFDFENFRNAHDFFHHSRPIIPMMNQLKRDIATGNKVVMVTARADFDDRELFLDTFRKYGVDMSKVHVYRAGNMTAKIQTEEKKKIIIRRLLDQGNYTKAIMYDDAVPNLESFVELKQEYPHTKFYAWHVSLEGEASEYHRTNEQQLKEFAVDDSGDEEHALRKYARMWYQGDDDTQHRIEKILAHMGWEIGEIESEEGGAFVVQAGDEHGNSYIGFAPEDLMENFADGRNPKDKGDSKRYHVPTKGSISSLRKIAKQGGRRGQLAHWMANMKAGRAKHKKS